MVAWRFSPAVVLIIVLVATVSSTIARNGISMWEDSTIDDIELEKLNVAVDNYINNYILIPWSSISKLPNFSSTFEPGFFAREALCQHFGYELPSAKRKEDVKLLEKILRNKVSDDLIMLADRIKSYPIFCFFFILAENKGAVQADLCIATTKFVLCVRQIISSTTPTTTLESNESQETTIPVKQLEIATLLGKQLQITPSPNTTNATEEEAPTSTSDKTRNKIIRSIIFICFFILIF